ncbi:uncharacterized protein ARMOST_03055 [Armillaria ostoyae]|uniref:Uncharacterized protein n=1 Tax=Armillaria ostoyae TaxID=47428 RepID=A0A284QTE0_ARMOS|nr:uncharacterized protein ARMOST_03055 [Armillaria ostoyae]
MGGGGRYPYPKYVWSPAGGWWVQPSNWKANTAIVATGIFAIAYLVGSLSAAREQRPVAPKKWIPSMLWAKQFQEAEKVLPPKIIAFQSSSSFRNHSKTLSLRCHILF